MQCNILIIDDDKDDIEFLVDALSDCNVRCVRYMQSATDAFMFLQSVKTREELPKLIITDLKLPGMSGDEFIALMKKSRLLKHIPVFIFSTSIPEREMERYGRMETVGFIKKPNNYNEYLAVAKMLKDKVAA